MNSFTINVISKRRWLNAVRDNVGFDSLYESAHYDDELMPAVSFFAPCYLQIRRIMTTVLIPCQNWLCISKRNGNKVRLHLFTLYRLGIVSVGRNELITQCILSAYTIQNSCIVMERIRL